jgi:hypothetical protein
LVLMAEEDGGDQKVGGISRKWWYVIGAGAGIVGYFIYRHYKNQQAASTAIGAMPSGAGTASTDLSGSNTTTGSSAGISTLNDWMSAAQLWLDATLKADPALVQEALQRYANGECLTAAEYALIDKALGQLGMPPDAPYQGLIKCAPAPPPKPKPPAWLKWPTPPKAILSKFQLISGGLPSAKLLMAEGFDVFSFGGKLYYFAGQKNTTARAPGHILEWVSSAALARQLQQEGYHLYNFAGVYFYDPSQTIKRPAPAASK